MKFIVKILSSGFFSGYIPKASGTFASLIASGMWIWLSKERFYPAVPLFFILAGFPIAGYAEMKIYHKKDSSKIVIDEMAGVLTTFLSFRFTLTLEGFIYLAAGFTLFRIFDIVKPPPIARLQRIGGGPGIMLDDLASGAVSNGLLQVLRFIIG